MDASPQLKPPPLQKPPGYRDPTTPPLQTTPKPFPPPRKAALPTTFRQKRKRRGCCRICCCIFCVIFLVLIFAAAVAAGLIYIVYDPALPVFHLGSFRFTKMNVTESTDGAYLDANTTARVEVKNRSSRMVWHFQESSVQITAENGDLNLGSTKVAGFEVKQKNKTDVKAETTVKGEALDERQRRKLKGTFDAKALVPTVEVQTRTGVSMQGWKSGSIPVTVVCGGVSLKNLENGDMPQCSYTLFKW